jgi:hypothetical protein
MDLSNKSVVLDAAVVPVTPSTLQAIRTSLKRTRGWRVKPIITDHEELLVWQHVIPAVAERCRDWSHNSSCEYKSQGKIPLSVEPRDPLICSCGAGIFNVGYDVGDEVFWDSLSKKAVRIALPPCFPVPFGSGRPDSEIEDVDGMSDDDFGDLCVRNLECCYVCGRTEDYEGGKS